MGHVWLIAGLEFHFSTASAKHIFSDDYYFDDADEVFLIFGDTLCFGHCILFVDCVEYIRNTIRMDVGAVDCFLALLVQFYLRCLHTRRKGRSLNMLRFL